MMEVECSTPRGSPTPDGSPPRHHSPPSTTIIPSMTSIRPTPTITYKSSNGNSNGMVTTRLTPLSEYEVSSSAAAIATTLTPTASPLSGFSSPFSLRTTPSLSRNNSDASQYGGSVSAGPASSVSDTSPLSPSQFSPTHSPVQSRHHPHQQVCHFSPFVITSSVPKKVPFPEKLNCSFIQWDFFGTEEVLLLLLFKIDLFRKLI